MDTNEIRRRGVELRDAINEVQALEGKAQHAFDVHQRAEKALADSKRRLAKIRHEICGESQGEYNAILNESGYDSKRLLAAVDGTKYCGW